jgi:ATP-dependent Zn protease
MTSKARRVTFLLTGLLLVGSVVGLIAFAAMPKHRLMIPINDLARLMKDGQIASVEVNGNDSTATTRQQKTFGFRMDQPGSLPQLLESFGVTSEQLSQVSYSISSPSQLGAFATAASAFLPVVLLGGLARRMVTEYGMSERLGVVTLGARSEHAGSGAGSGDRNSYSEQTAQLIDAEIRRLIEEGYLRAQGVINEQRSVLDRLAHALLRWETLQGHELELAFTGELQALEPGPAHRHHSPARLPTGVVSPQLLPGAAIIVQPDGD